MEKISISEAITRAVIWVMKRGSLALNRFFPYLLKHPVHPRDRRETRNANQLRSLIQKIIIDRRSGKGLKYGEGTTDLLEILITNDFYKNQDELMIDEIVTFFVAGMKTLQLSSTNLIWYMAKNPEMRKKLLAEILPCVEAAKDDIATKLEYDTVMDFDYLH